MSILNEIFPGIQDEKPNYEMEFDYDVDCELDGYLINFKEAPDWKTLMQEVLNHAKKNRIDRHFAIDHTIMKEFSANNPWRFPRIVRELAHLSVKFENAEQRPDTPFYTKTDSDAS